MTTTSSDGIDFAFGGGDDDDDDGDDEFDVPEFLR